MITKDDLIMDIIDKWPETAQAFMQLGMHCIYCEAASGESLEQALQGHGFEPQEIDDIVEQLNDFVSEVEKDKAENAPEEKAAESATETV